MFQVDPSLVFFKQDGVADRRDLPGKERPAADAGHAGDRDEVQVLVGDVLDGLRETRSRKLPVNPPQSCRSYPTLPRRTEGT